MQVVAARRKPKTQRGLVVKLDGLPKALCRILWYDLSTGSVINDFRLRTDASTLTLKVPDFDRHIAFKVLYERFE
ncbi:MAG: hypothetical protein U5N86_03790 [Planctomycetota bacterium]|nr:hypothetical protein [Planctomycetota bacterium]